ncbi:MAG TPA: site-specific integrase [Acidimicrobiales bacterium]|nr:site-specific integrase [Acidimicrobiales bacterium]
MATVRQRSSGVWEIRVFTGRNRAGRPTQVSRTVRGTKREAQRVAAAMEARAPSSAAGRTVADVLAAWMEVNEAVWSDSSRRDYASRARFVANDSIGKLGIARLGVADVERWHAAMRRAGVGEQAIRNRHSVLRAAIAQAVRWEWVSTNAASVARLRQSKQAPRKSISGDDVRAAIRAATTIDPAAALALRLAAVAGLRRSELAALRWSEINGDRLTVDSSVAIRREEGAAPVLIDAPTKTANQRTVRLDPATVAELAALRREREALSPYLFSLDEHPAPPARVGWWWSRSRDLAAIDRRWRLHDLRHWSATMAISGGHDVRTVAGRLGHANAAMTLRVYAHAVDSADGALALALGGALDGGVEG